MTEPQATEPQATEPRWLTDTEHSAWRGWVELGSRLDERLNRQLQRDSGLSAADYEVLVNLSEAEDGRLRAFQLGALIRWEKSRLSHHLTRMEKRGLIAREECPTDGRGAYVVLTPAGRSAIETAAPLHVDEVRRSFVDLLSDEQLQQLVEITDVVLGVLRDDPDR